MADNLFNSSSSTAPSGTSFNLSGLSDPTKMNVDEKTQTVAGQLGNIMSSDSPLIQQARTRAAQTMNQRGLANSSMALSAADSAAYETALPIANADAGIYNDAAKLNTMTDNQFKAAGNQQAYGLQTGAANQGYTQQNLATQQTNDLAKMDKQASTTLNQMAVDQTNTLGRIGAQSAATKDQMAAQSGYDIAKLNAQSTAAKDVAGIEASYKNLTQGSASAVSIVNKMQDSLNALMANKDITDQTKRDAMAADIKTNASEALNLVGSLAGDVDLSNYISKIGL